MKRTIDIMTTARAKGVELPEKWFGATCMNCPNAYAIESGHQCAMCGHIMRDDPPLEYIGPDLELAENIHHAFTVADALAKQRGREPVSCFPLWTEFRCMIDVPANIGASAPERHLALVAACEAALGIEREEVGA